MKNAKPPRRQIFVLTPEEKTAVCCVLAAFLLGLATKHYRDGHPRPPPPPTAKEQRAAKAAAARARSAPGALIPPRPTATPAGGNDE